MFKGMFGNTTDDSIYARRVARGEIPTVPFGTASRVARGEIPTVPFGTASRVEELKQTISELHKENNRLRYELEKVQEQLKGLQVSLSLEEVINGFAEEKKAAPSLINPFVGFVNNTASDASDDGGKSDAMMTPDNTLSEIICNAYDVIPDAAEFLEEDIEASGDDGR